MIKFKGIGINLILGVLMGILFATMIMVEGYVILSSREMANGLVYEIAAKDLSIFKIIAVLVFMVTIILFNTRKIKSMNLNKIGIYLILSVIGALIAAIEFIALGMTCVVKFMPDVTSYVTENYLLAMNMIYIVVLLGIAVFLLVFTLFVNKKVKYIKFLSSEVKVIKDEDFGKTIEVRGQDELAELCSSINNMSLELREKIDNEKKIEQNKNELITNVSHDLRTPLTSIKGYLGLINEDKYRDEVQLRYYVDIAYQKSKELEVLINDLFELTKVQNNSITLDKIEIDLVELLNQIIFQFGYQFQSEKIKERSFFSEDKLIICADPNKLVRVFQNLINNGIKYGTGEFLDIYAYKKGSYAVVDVVSYGNPIPSVELPYIFDKFYRVEKSRNKNDGGSGLGLAITKSIVTLHGGIINAQSDGEKTIFKVMLPLLDKKIKNENKNS